jgi:hypothetical protein
VALAAAAIPKGIYLIYCAFNPQKLLTIKDLHLQLTVAGLCAVFLAAVTIKSGLEKNPNDTTPPLRDATRPPPRNAA